MRDSLSVDITVSRFAGWRAAVFGISVLAVAALLAWALLVVSSSAPPADPFGRHAAIVACAGAAAVAWLARGLWRVDAGRLARRHGAWTFAPAGAGAEPVGVEVAVDLGSFLLLRLAPGRGSAVRWLPLQRRGLAAADWHALRVALYAPRGSSGATDAAGAAE